MTTRASIRAGAHRGRNGSGTSSGVALAVGAQAPAAASFVGGGSGADGASSACGGGGGAADAAANASAAGFAVHARLDGRLARRAAAWRRRWGLAGEDWGYVQTDLALLDLRRRGGRTGE